MFNEDDVKVLEFIYDRMHEVHNESIKFDYMLSFSKVLTKIEKFLTRKKEILENIEIGIENTRELIEYHRERFGYVNKKNKLYCKMMEEEVKNMKELIESFK